MKKTRSNHTSAVNFASRKPVKHATKPESAVRKNVPAPPSEEMVARLNAIAREYPFCVMYKQNNSSLL